MYLISQLAKFNGSFMLKKHFQILVGIFIILAINQNKTADIFIDKILPVTIEYADICLDAIHTSYMVYNQLQNRHEAYVQNLPNTKSVDLNTLKQRSIYSSLPSRRTILVDNSSSSAEIAKPYVTSFISQAHVPEQSSSLTSVDKHYNTKSPSNSPLFGMLSESNDLANQRYLDQIEEQNEKVFDELKKDRTKALQYLDNIEQFCEILLLSNSTNFHDRVYARLRLPHLLDFGPLNTAKRQALADVIPYYFDDKLQLKTEVIPDATNRIILSTDYIRREARKNEDLILAYQGLISDYHSHLHPSNDLILSKAKKLRLYNVENASPKIYHGWFYDERVAKNVACDEALFKQAKLVEDLMNAFDIDKNGNFAKAHEIYLANISDPLIVECYNSWKEYYLNKFATNFITFKNDPLFKNELMDYSLMINNFEEYYKYYRTLHIRNQIKDKIRGDFHIKIHSDKIDKILYKLVNNINDSQKQIKILNEIAVNKELSLENKQIYETFYHPINGLLKCFQFTDFFQRFRINDKLDKQTQSEVCSLINKVLFYPVKTDKEKLIVDDILKLLKSANTNKLVKPCLNVAKCSVEALYGNKDYNFVLLNSELLKYPNGVIQLDDKIQEIQNKNTPSAKQINKQIEEIKQSYTSSSSPNPDDPEKNKDKEKKGRDPIAPNKLNETSISQKEKEHIFSPDHKKNGIYDLANNSQKDLAEIEILSKVSKIIKITNGRKLLQPGLNQIRTLINGHKTEIKVFMENGKILASIDVFKGWSSRNFGNIINLILPRL